MTLEGSGSGDIVTLTARTTIQRRWPWPQKRIEQNITKAAKRLCPTPVLPTPPLPTSNPMLFTAALPQPQPLHLPSTSRYSPRLSPPFFTLPRHCLQPYAVHITHHPPTSLLYPPPPPLYTPQLSPPTQPLPTTLCYSHHPPTPPSPSHPHLPSTTLRHPVHLHPAVAVHRASQWR